LPRQAFLSWTFTTPELFAMPGFLHHAAVCLWKCARSTNSLHERAAIAVTDGTACRSESSTCTAHCAAKVSFVQLLCRLDPISAAQQHALPSRPALSASVSNSSSMHMLCDRRLWQYNAMAFR
jgi:hypothetical protein